MTAAQALRIEVGAGETVSALLIQPAQARACYVFAHGAGAGMTHASMETVAAGLADAASRRCAINFPIWRKAASGPMRRRWRMPPFAPPWQKPDNAAPPCP